MRTPVPEQLTPAASESLGVLLARQGRFVGGKIVQAMAVTGLTLRHRAVLAELFRRGPTSQQDLLRSLSVDPGVLVAVLNDLEHRGLAERRRDPTDRRRHIVEMSVPGREVLCRIETAISQVEAWLFADLDEDEGERLRALLGKVRTTPDGPDIGPEPVGSVATTLSSRVPAASGS